MMNSSRRSARRKPQATAINRRPWASGAPTFAMSSSSACSTKPDRKSTRLNSSHLGISYAAFCFKKKNQAEQAFLGAGLHQVLKGAELHRHRHRLGLTETTNQNHVKARIDRLDFVEHLQAVDAWDDEVE